MENEELKEKLAKFAEFTSATWEYSDGSKLTTWTSPNRKECYRTHELPFLNSLDACFKWLVPKTIDKIMVEQECSSDLAYAILFKRWLQELELNIAQPTASLCKAIEKMVDEESPK